MIRTFNPDTDSSSKIVELWNEALGTDLFTVAHLDRLNPANVVVVEEAGEVVGFAMLLDGGLPYAVLDQLYVRPRYQRFTTLRDVLQFVEELCRERGVRWFYSVLSGSGAEAEQAASLLRRRGQWPNQYLGEKPMLCRPISV